MFRPAACALILATAALLRPAGAPAQSGTLPRLKVSENHRYLVTEDGRPFFWLGDTAWELFHRATREDAERYLKNRAALRFTVIQAVALAEFDGLTVPNAYGHTPLHDNDPTQPDEQYFTHVDWIVAKANALGLYVGFLPTWGDKWNKKWGVGPEIFTPETAGALRRVAGPALQGRRPRVDPRRRSAGRNRSAQGHPSRDGARACARATAART